MADSAVLSEKPVISAGRASASECTLTGIYKKILYRDRKPPLKGLFLGVFSLLSFFFRYLLFSTIYFLTPPEWYIKTKKSPSHFVRASSHIPYYSTGIGRVCFFSSLFANRTSKTPFL